MVNVLILGATGSIGTVVRNQFIAKTQNHLTLFARHPHREKGKRGKELITPFG